MEEDGPVPLLHESIHDLYLQRRMYSHHFVGEMRVVLGVPESFWTSESRHLETLDLDII